MYKGILHTHILIVTMFLVIYLVKTILLLTNKKEALQKFTKQWKIPEMIISVLFLLTGIYLWMNSGNIGSWFYVKLLAVLLSIPIAIIGFKKSNKLLAVLSVVLILYAYGVSETQSVFFKKANTEIINTALVDSASLGKYLYESSCISCHGADGKLGLSGAKDLSVSTLVKEERIKIISKGKGGMLPFQERLSEQEIESVAHYVGTLKKQ